MDPESVHSHKGITAEDTEITDNTAFTFLKTVSSVFLRALRGEASLVKHPPIATLARRGELREHET